MCIEDMIEDLLNEPVAEDNDIKFTSCSVQLIHQIAELCKDIPIVRETQEQAEEYSKDMTAEQVYIDMLVKIVEAPTALHMRCSARILIPIIDKKLKERGL